MTCQEMEERLDGLSRKCVELGRQYMETHDDKKIVEELYELVWDLQNLKNELLTRNPGPLRNGQSQQETQ